jgi:predicted membrane channel-forming protein YqfA (hemolysin III family)
MRIFLKILSFIGLGLTIIPSILVLAGTIDMEMNKNLMMAGTVLWFGTVIFWMNKNKKTSFD